MTCAATVAVFICVFALLYLEKKKKTVSLIYFLFPMYVNLKGRLGYRHSIQC